MSLKATGVKTLTMLAALLALAATALALDAQTDRQAGVRVDVAPQHLAAGQPASFKVSLNTHSVDLSQDLARAATLTDDAGTDYRPAKWEGSPPGGHHRSGVLSFPALGNGVKAVSLAIDGVGGVRRTFQWKLAQ